MERSFLSLSPRVLIGSAAKSEEFQASDNGRELPDLINLEGSRPRERTKSDERKTMANQEHLTVIKQGPNIWNLWRKAHPDLQPDISRASLKGADVRGMNLSGVNMRSTNLEDAALEGADLSGSNFHFENLLR